MSLNEAQKRQLRGLGHTLKPVVIIGAAGLSEGVLAEIDGSIRHHELIKVRVNAEDRDSRNAMIEHICQETGAELIQRIGHVALLYRRNPKTPRIKLSAG